MLTIVDIFEKNWLVEARFRRKRQSYTVGPEQIKWLYHPLPLFMAVSMIIKYQICNIRVAIACAISWLTQFAAIFFFC